MLPRPPAPDADTRPQARRDGPTPDPVVPASTDNDRTTGADTRSKPKTRARVATRACSHAGARRAVAAHARRVYGLLEVTQVTSAQNLAKRIATGKLADGFTAREVLRTGWSGLDSIRQIEVALGLLEEFGQIPNTNDFIEFSGLCSLIEIYAELT